MRRMNMYVARAVEVGDITMPHHITVVFVSVDMLLAALLALN